MEQERSSSGHPIFRHETAAEPWFSIGDPQLVAAIDAHVTEHIGAPARVWHELASPYVQVDIHVVEPSAEAPWFTLVTSGMSERAMAFADEERYAELMMCLPPTWPATDSEAFKRPEGDWPFRLLHDLAQLPHEFSTALWTGHTVPNGDPAVPYASDTKLCGALVAPPVLAPEGFRKLQLGEREIHLLAVIPLHRNEMELKLERGRGALYELLEEAEVTEVVQPDRPSVVGSRRWWRRR
jgi:hypothetical protein